MYARIVPIAVAIFLLAGLGWASAAPTDDPVLHAVVGPDFTITLKDAGGNDVRRLDPGPYTIQVNDRSELHNFHLVGPGVDQTTSVDFTGEVRWSVTFRDGTYVFRCDPHSTVMRGTFTVGNVTTTTAAPPPPPAPKPRLAKLTARVGPGSRIAFPARARAGRTQITVRDSSASENFHLVGPGVNKKTGVAFRGTAKWVVTLKKGTYTFRSDARGSKLKGTTRVR